MGCTISDHWQEEDRWAVRSVIIGRKKTGGLYYNIDYNMTNPPLTVRSV